MTLKPIASVACIAALVASAQGATFATGYTIGSNLLGSTIVDGASHSGLGTFDLRANDSANGAGAYVWVAAWEGLWGVGDSVSLTGIALPVRSPGAAGDDSNNTDNGTFTFTFYELTAGGTGWDGTDNGETILGTASVDFVSAGAGPALVPYATFDSALNFTAASTGIAIHVDSTSSIRTRWDDSADGVDGIHESRTTGAVINNGPRGHQWTVAGSVTPVPEPTVSLLGALGALLLFRRRR